MRTVPNFDDEPSAPPAAISPEAIRAAIRSAHLDEVLNMTTSIDATPVRRARRKTGRVHSFATRLRGDTLNEIHAYADHHEITLAEVIERAMAALKRP